MSETLRRGLGQAIRELRLEHKLVQEQLATLSGKHVTYLSMLEGGKRNPTIEVVEDIAHALGTTAWQLMRRAEEFGEGSG